MEQRMDTRGIDGIRGIAALGIAICSHYYFLLPELNYPFNNGITYWFWNYSSYFVDLFFVISGFLMAYLYADKIAQKQITFVSFIKKRIIRFYPLMVFSLFCVLFLQLIHQYLAGDFFVSDLITDNSLLSFLFNLLCLQGTSLVKSSFNAPSWYLSVLLIMYIIFYAAVFISSKFNHRLFAYFIMLVTGITLAVNGTPTVFLNCRGVIGFFAGCLLYEIITAVHRLPEKVNIVIDYAAFIVLVCVAFLGIGFGYGIFARPDQVVIVYEILIWPLIVFSAVEIPWIRAILKCKVLTYLGKISFAMYLMHFPAMLILVNCNIAFGLNVHYESKKFFVLYVISVLLIAVVCHYFVEQKFAGLLKGVDHEKKLQASD